MPPPPTARRNRTRRGRTRKSPTFHVSVFNCMPEPWKPWERDWAELPADAISCVLHKLRLPELLLGGVAEVCRSWRRAAREEPELWRYINVRWLPKVPPFTHRATLENIMRAPFLKSLNLTDCYRIFRGGGFANAIKKFPLLEYLTLVNCYCIEEALQLIAKVCPCLKHFELVHQISCHSYRIKECADNRKAFAIARMHGLRSLKLVDDNLGNQGLAAIIDNCPNLKYLHIRDCCNISMDGNLTVKCAHIIMDYREYFPPSEPCGCVSPMSYGQLSDYDYDD
ncbi:hypothetical protein ACQ4PT_006667 [Festuca glaucescens]